MFGDKSKSSCCLTRHTDACCETTARPFILILLVCYWSAVLFLSTYPRSLSISLHSFLQHLKNSRLISSRHLCPSFPSSVQLFHKLQKLTPLFCHFLTALHLSQGQSQWVIHCLGQGQDYRNVFFDLFRQCCLIFPSLCFKPSEKSHCSCYAMTVFFCFPHWPLKKWLIHHFKYPLMHRPQKAAILFVKRSTRAWPCLQRTRTDTHANTYRHTRCTLKPFRNQWVRLYERVTLIQSRIGLHFTGRLFSFFILNSSKGTNISC